jgi:hypothetical protein
MSSGKHDFIPNAEGGALPIQRGFKPDGDLPRCHQTVRRPREEVRVLDDADHVLF